MGESKKIIETSAEERRSLNEIEKLDKTLLHIRHLLRTGETITVEKVLTGVSNKDDTQEDERTGRHVGIV